MVAPINIIREYLGEDYHLSPDFAKSVTGNKAKGSRVKGTQPHRDMYSTDRLQGMINNDGRTKLFFVPRSHKNITKEHQGFKQCEVSLTESMAVAPPPNTYILWRSGVIHFEGVSKSDPSPDGLYRCHRKGMVSSRRLRFYAGFCRNLDRGIMEQLARYASMGVCPAFYNGVNKGSIVDPVIVCRKTTRAMKPRELSADDKRIFGDIIKMDSLEENSEKGHINKDVRWLYGLCS